MKIITRTAWEIASNPDYEQLVDDTHEIFVGIRGRIAYHFIKVSNRNKVILQRIDTRINIDAGGHGKADGFLNIVQRSVKPETILVLKPINK